MKPFAGGGGEGAGVAEIQGLYGAFSFPEKLLQQIWMRGDFAAANASTVDGRRVEVLHPGRWNFQGGPDFKGARLRIGNVVTTGDVELHLHASDWRAHGHATDAAYDDVQLHVVLFPGVDRMTAGAGGREIPLLVLLPLLLHDLEEYAADAAVERLANHPLTRAHEALAALSEAALRVELDRLAAARWRQKIHYAKIRIDRVGWTEACHQTALEILGYRANRSAMLAIGAACPLAAWRSAGEAAKRESWIEELYKSPAAAWRWNRQAVRPANHPRTRLRQYASWTSVRPDWPDELALLAAKLPAMDGLTDERNAWCTARVRKEHGFRQLRQHIATAICAEAVGGSRLDTLICDGFFPLIAAQADADVERVRAHWQHWFSGDVPAKWLALLRGLHVIGGRDWPSSHGTAQGLLGWLLAEDKKQNFGDSAEGRGT